MIRPASSPPSLFFRNLPETRRLALQHLTPDYGNFFEGGPEHHRHRLFPRSITTVCPRSPGKRFAKRTKARAPATTRLIRRCPPDKIVGRYSVNDLYRLALRAAGNSVRHRLRLLPLGALQPQATAADGGCRGIKRPAMSRKITLMKTRDF